MRVEMVLMLAGVLMFLWGLGWAIYSWLGLTPTFLIVTGLLIMAIAFISAFFAGGGKAY